MKSPQAFRSIGEVARLVGVATHVLRYWETQFPALAPVRRPDGRRYYRPDDLLLAAGLCEVLREDGLTIRGARRLIDLDKGAALRDRGRLRLEGALVPQGNDAPAKRSAPRESRARPSAPPQGKAGAAPDPGAHAGADLSAVSPALQEHGRSPDNPAVPDAGGTTIPTSGTVDRDRPSPAPADGWLARLNATAAALRLSAAALPPHARDLARALRAARDRPS